MPEDPALTDVLDLLDDEYARAILAATSTRPMSAPELAEACDASRPTVYRRIDRLKQLDLVVERTRPEGDGHHVHEYESRFRGLSVTLRDGEYRVTVDRREDPADRFTGLWEGLR